MFSGIGFVHRTIWAHMYVRFTARKLVQYIVLYSNIQYLFFVQHMNCNSTYSLRRCPRSAGCGQFCYGRLHSVRRVHSAGPILLYAHSYSTPGVHEMLTMAWAQRTGATSASQLRIRVNAGGDWRDWSRETGLSMQAPAQLHTAKSRAKNVFPIINHN